MTLRPGRGISAARSTIRRGRQRSATSGSYIPLAECATMTTACGWNPSLKGFYERVCMPSQALIGPVHSQRRRANVMTTALELQCRKLPAFGPLAAATYETV
jgi:hypothetical protein